MEYTGIEQRRASDRERQRTHDLLGLLPKGRRSILDIGAREGYFSVQFTEYFPEVTALDLEKPSFEHPGVTTVAGDVTRLDYPDNSFDCVFCAEVLEHIPALETACREIVRVARHEIVIGVPFQQDIRVGRTTCGSCGNINPPWGHINSFTEQRLIKLFSGVRLVRKSFVGTNKEATTSLAAFLMDRAGNPWGTYAQYETCGRCGGKVTAPVQRDFLQRACGAAATYLNLAQSLFTSPHGNWIHVVFSKDQSGSNGLGQ